MRAILAVMLLTLPGLAACSRDAAGPGDAKGATDAVRMPSVTVSGDDSSVEELNWRPPAVALAPEGGIDLTPYAAVRRWLARVKALPGFLGMPGV